jgi:hypothetical protein
VIVHLNHSCFKVIGLLAITVLTIGCSEERPGEALPKITVEGQVIREGKPLTSGWVEMVPVDGGKGVMQSGPIDPTGHYLATGLGPGLHGFRVIVPRDKTLFPFDQFFSPIRRTFTTDSVQTFDLNLSEESTKPK